MTTQPETAPLSLFDGRVKLGDRLKTAREGTNLSRDAVVERATTGFSRSSLQAWEAGEREPSLDNLFELAQIYGTHPWELLTGQRSEYPASNDDDYAYVAAYDIEASAGHGMFTDGAVKPDRYLAFRRQWIRERSLDTNQLAAIFTKGDSMTPTVPDGATIVIDLRHRMPVDGKIFVIRIGDRLWIKRTRWIPAGALRLISDNPDYEPFDIPRAELNHGDFEVCGQVVNASFDLY